MFNSNCCFLTCIQVSQEAGKVVWYSHLLKNFPQFVVMHTVKGFSIVNEAEVDVFLEFLCFFYDPMDVGNLISGSSAFSKSSLYIWKFSVLVLLTPSLEGFKHDLAGMWNECYCVVVWTFFDIALLALRTPWTVWKSMTFEKVKMHVIKHYVNMIWFCQDFVYMCEYMHICKGDIWKKKSQMVTFIYLYFLGFLWCTYITLYGFSQFYLIWHFRKFRKKKKVIHLLVAEGVFKIW